MTQDEQQLNLLGIFHYIVGGITALFACFPMIHLAVGIAMLSGAMGEGPDAPPRALGWGLTIVAAFFILAGWTLAGFIITAGKRLQQRRSWMFCLVIAALECLFMPLGTVLGVFTIIVLMRESVKELFGVNTGSNTTPST